MERMVNTRLYHLAEARGIFNHSQAGFRKNRSCEDQLLRMIQDVSDGFQEKKPRRTVMALLDLSRAYDRVWKEDLILTLIDSGVPLKLVRWFNAFLSNRQFRVMFNGSLSRTRWLIHRVPQGAVTSPCCSSFTSTPCPMRSKNLSTIVSSLTTSPSGPATTTKKKLADTSNGPSRRSKNGARRRRCSSVRRAWSPSSPLAPGTPDGSRTLRWGVTPSSSIPAPNSWGW